MTNDSGGNAYEAQRRARIAQNKQRLASLKAPSPLCIGCHACCTYTCHFLCFPLFAPLPAATSLACCAMQLKQLADDVAAPALRAAEAKKSARQAALGLPTLDAGPRRRSTRAGAAKTRQELSRRAAAAEADVEASSASSESGSEVDDKKEEEYDPLGMLIQTISSLLIGRAAECSHFGVLFELSAADTMLQRAMKLRSQIAAATAATAVWTVQAAQRSSRPQMRPRRSPNICRSQSVAGSHRSRPRMQLNLCKVDW